MLGRRVVPSDYPVMSYFLAGIPNNAAHSNAARLLIAFLMTRAGQDFEWDADGTDYHGLPGSKLAPIVAAYEARGAKFVDEVDVETEHPDLLKVQKQMLEALQASIQR